MGSWDGATSETGPTALLGPFLEGICHNPSAGQFCSVENTTFLHTTVSQTLHLKHNDAELKPGVNLSCLSDIPNQQANLDLQHGYQIEITGHESEDLLMI